MALLLDPVVYSATKMFQAHVISLVSKVIDSGLSSSSGNLTLDISYYLATFQKSVSLYSKHVSSLQMGSCCIELSCAYNRTMFERGLPIFESYIQEGTHTKLNQVLSKSNSSLDSYGCKMSSKIKVDFLTEYIEYMKGRQYIFADSCRGKAASTLDYIIHQAFSQDVAGDLLYLKKNTNAEDIYLLASILKLMSVSLLQAIKCLSKSDDSGLAAQYVEKSANKPWKYFIESLRLCSEHENVPGNKAVLEMHCMVKLQEALKDTCDVNWVVEVDYVAPGCFMYLVEWLLLLTSCLKGSIYATKSSFT
ncbi:unnamed protein product [Vicia faba]|uniref:DUF7812 domain-containing protein n=1 Tax=Vicia faba TaxID=3906 RepID=A0AAV1AN93_VICFA|nr:unnamed protein product [Vicia faba]